MIPARGGILRSLLDVLLPPLCHLCKEFIPDAGEVHICDSCRRGLPLVGPSRCTICGIPFAGVGGSHPCGDCLAAPPGYDAAAAPLLYEAPVSGLIHDYKYRHQTHLRRPLALLALEGEAGFLADSIPDLIMPVPLHRCRLGQRGFNQALLMAELVAARLQRPLVRRELQRIRPTQPQIGLSADERRHNVRGAFALGRPDRVAGRRILLVDDVLTTGSTVDECARVLKRAGAESVRVLTAARAAR